MKKQMNNVPEIETRPALTPEGSENELISLAVSLVKQRLLNGTASAQETTFFLKLAANREKSRLEEEKLRTDNELSRAKINSIDRQEHAAEAYEEVLAAMRKYNGLGGSDD